MPMIQNLTPKPSPTNGPFSQTEVSIYFISLVYTEHGLALGTAFVPDGEWLRKMKVQSTLLGP
jgi:hypothetical protein